MRVSSRFGIILLLILIPWAFVVLTFRAYGIAWDEPYKILYGELVRLYYVTLGQDARSTVFRDLYLYGGFFDLLLAIFRKQFADLGLFESVHLGTGLFGSLIFLGLWRLTEELHGRRAAFFAVVLLALCPRFIGELCVNQKDIPFAVLYCWSVFYLVRAVGVFPNASWITVILYGLFAGAAAGIRVGGLVLAHYFDLFAIIFLVSHIRTTPPRVLARLVAQVAIVNIIAWSVMVLFWPYAQKDPLFGPIHALDRMQHFHIGMSVLYMGRSWDVALLPWHYPLVWFAIALPVPFILSSLLGLGGYIRKLSELKVWTTDQSTLRYAAIIVAGIFPLLIVFVLGASLYDGLRHLLFLVPILAVPAGIGVEKLLASTKSKFGLRTLQLVLTIFVVEQVALIYQLFPYEYVYFNEVIGGLPGAAKQFESEYWGLSYKEGVEWTASHCRLNRPIAVFGTMKAESTSYYVERQPDSLVYVTEVEKADIELTTTRLQNHLKENWPIAKIIEREGVPILYVKRAPTSRVTCRE